MAEIQFPPAPADETPEQRKERITKERELYFRDLIERKYPELKNQEQDKAKNVEGRKRAAGMQEDQKDKIHLTPIDMHPDDMRIIELNRDAAHMVKDQVGYYVQMAHKHRSPRASVPWIRFIGCERGNGSWGAYLQQQLHADPTQRLTIVRMQRMQPFMVCMDERHQFDAGTDKRIKRLLGLYQAEFDEQRAKFQQHRKAGLTEDEHKNRTSFFAKETAWREAKKRKDEKDEEERKKTGETEAPKTSSTSKTSQVSDLYLRNHTFPPTLKQEQYNFVVVSYFRDLLAFQRCFHDLALSVEDAEFQPILIAWAFAETKEEADRFRQWTQCNHPFLQKHLYILDLYKWVPLDSENLNNVPITYANKYQNEIMHHRETEQRAIDEYHAWERERYGAEADFHETPVYVKTKEQ